MRSESLVSSLALFCGAVKAEFALEEMSYELEWAGNCHASNAIASGSLVLATKRGNLFLHLEARMSTYGVPHF